MISSADRSLNPGSTISLAISLSTRFFSLQNQIGPLDGLILQKMQTLSQPMMLSFIELSETESARNQSRAGQ